MSVSQQLEILGKAKKLRPLPPEAVTASSVAPPPPPPSTPQPVKAGPWIKKQRPLELETSPRPVPPAAAATAVKMEPLEERKSTKKAPEDEIQVAPDALVDEPETDEGPACGFCGKAPGRSHACCACKQVFCIDCQNDHPEECLGDNDGPNRAWQCFGCLNKKSKPKRKLKDSCEDLIEFCNASERELTREFKRLAPIDAPSAPPLEATSAKRHDSYCSILPDPPEEVLVYKEPLREHCQLPLCLFCVKHKNPTIYTIGSALGVAVPCGHAVVCKECAVDFCIGKKNLKCPFAGCGVCMDSVVLIQNSVQPKPPTRARLPQ